MQELESIVSAKIHGTQDNLTSNGNRSFRELLLAHLLVSITEDQTTQAYGIARETMSVLRYHNIPKDIKQMIVDKAIKQAVCLIILDKIKQHKPIPTIKVDIIGIIEDVAPQTFKDLIEQIAKLTKTVILDHSASLSRYYRQQEEYERTHPVKFFTWE